MSDGLQSRYIKLVNATFTNAGQKAMLCLQLKVLIARLSLPSCSLFGETLARDHMLHFLSGNPMAAVTAIRGAFRAR